MPKIRKKIKLKVSGSYPTKSGVLSKSIKKIVQDEDIQQGRIPTDFFHSRNEDIPRVRLKGTIFYDAGAFQFYEPDFDFYKINLRNNTFFDEKTIVYGNKNVNPALGVTSSIINDLNIFSGPNTFTTGSNFEISRNDDPSLLNYYKLNQSIFKEEFKPFDENLLTELTGSEIIIDLPFDHDLFMDNLGAMNDRQYLAASGSTYNFRHGETIPVTNHYPYESNHTAYYNWNSNSWDHNTYFNLENSWKDYDVKFTLPTTPFTMNSSSSIGLPVSSQGFPYAQYNLGSPSHYITLENHITKPFILEKIKLELTLTSIAEKSAAISDGFFLNSSNVDLANTLNFFMLRGITSNVNTQLFKMSGSLTPDRVFISDPITDGTYTNAVNSNYNGILRRNGSFFIKAGADKTLFPVGQDYNNAGYDDIYQAWFKPHFNNNVPNLLSQVNSIDQVSELITYANFLVYNNHNRENSNICWEKAISDIDYVKKIETGTNALDAHLNFTSASFVIESNCKTVNSYKNGSAHIMNRQNADPYYSTDGFIVFHSNELGGRNAIGLPSGREFEGTSAISNARVSKTDTVHTDGITGYSVKYNHIQEGSKNSPYVLMPKDKILFGLNSFSNLAEFPALFKLHDKIRVRLIGRYQNSGDSNITSSNKRGMTSNSIRHTIIGNTHVVDQYDTEPIYFMSGSYLDNIFTGSLSSTSGRTIKGSLSSGLEGTFTRTVTLTDTGNTIYDSMMPSILDIMKLNNKNPWTQVLWNGSSYYSGSNILYFVDQRNYGYEDIRVYNSEEFYEWGGSFQEWTYDFPFKEEYSNLPRYLNLNLENTAKQINWSTTSQDVENMQFEYFTTLNTYSGLLTGSIDSGSILVATGAYYNGYFPTLSDERNFGAKLRTLDENFWKRTPKGTLNITGSFGEGATITTGSDNYGGVVGLKIFETSVEHAVTGNIEFGVYDSTRFVAPFNPNGSFSFSVAAKGASKITHQYNLSANDLYKTNKHLFSNTRVVDFPLITSIYFAPYYGLKSSIAGKTGVVGTYGNPPISSFKYGVYNPNPVKLTKHFNWRSYGQFSDMYNSSTNTAFFEGKDRAIVYPIKKEFRNPFHQTITTGSYTYNKDVYSRSGRPFYD